MSRNNRVARGVCPVCGSQILVSTMRSHVGSSRCLEMFKASSGKFHDVEHGPTILEAARMLDKALMSAVRLR